MTINPPNIAPHKSFKTITNTVRRNKTNKTLRYCCKAAVNLELFISVVLICDVSCVDSFKSIHVKSPQERNVKLCKILQTQLRPLRGTYTISVEISACFERLNADRCRAYS